MFEFLLFGSMVWFWILFGFLSLVLFVSVENNSPAHATIATMIFVGLFSFFGILPGGESLLELFSSQPYYILIGLVAFFGLGTAWAIVKWWFYVRNLAEKRKKQIAKHGKKAPKISGPHYYRAIKKPMASNNKSRIMTWMCLWPYSFVWTMIDDPVRRVFKAIYTRISATLQHISDKAFEGLEPMKKDEPENPFPLDK